jgi:hypothetical protein
MVAETADSQPAAMGRTIDFTLTRRDIWQLNLELAPRLAATWWLLLMLCILIAALSVGSTCIVCGDAEDLGSFLTRLGLTIGAAVLGFPVLYLILFGFVMLFVSPRWDVLGAQSVDVRDDGFFVTSRAGEASHSWSGIRSVIRTENWLVIRTRAYRFHVIPARAFRARAVFENIAADIAARVAAAKERGRAAPG